MNKTSFVRCLKECFRPTGLLKAYRYYTTNKKQGLNGTTIGMGTVVVDSDMESNIFIGDNCRVKDSSIGRRSYLNSDTSLNSASLGCFSSIGSQVVVGVGSHPTNYVSTHPAFYSNNKSFETFADKMYCEEYFRIAIGNDVWIGSNSTIMGNVNIGDGAIIAYGAIVTKNIPPYAIVGGGPARVIKYRFDELTINRLLEIKWWQLSDVFLKKHFKLMHNPKLIIDFYDSNKEYVESFRNQQ